MADLFFITRGGEMNCDLFMVATDGADALQLWREYGVQEGWFTDPETQPDQVFRVQPGTERGILPWYSPAVAEAAPSPQVEAEPGAAETFRSADGTTRCARCGLLPDECTCGPNSARTILGLDPGVSTGVAVAIKANASCLNGGECRINEDGRCATCGRPMQEDRP